MAHRQKYHQQMKSLARLAAVLSAFISSGAEQTGTYGGEVNGKIAGRHFEHLLCETT